MLSTRKLRVQMLLTRKTVLHITWSPKEVLNQALCKLFHVLNISSNVYPFVFPTDSCEGSHTIKTSDLNDRVPADLGALSSGRLGRNWFGLVLQQGTAG